MYEYKSTHLENSSTAPYEPFNKPIDFEFDAYINKRGDSKHGRLEPQASALPTELCHFQETHTSHR